MTFWHYIIIGCIIQAIIIIERFIRLPYIRQMFKENLTDPVYLIGFLSGSVINAVAWPLSIYCEIRLIQNEMQKKDLGSITSPFLFCV